jgi:hypothetical protein
LAPPTGPMVRILFPPAASLRTLVQIEPSIIEPSIIEPSIIGSSLGPGVATSANRHGGVIRDRGCTDELAWRQWQPDRRSGRRHWGSALQLRASWIGPYCSILGWQRPQPGVAPEEMKVLPSYRSAYSVQRQNWVTLTRSVPAKLRTFRGPTEAPSQLPRRPANHAVPCPYSTMTCPYIQG